MDLERLTAAMRDTTAVVHLASNPDIARAMTDPTIDFRYVDIHLATGSQTRGTSAAWFFNNRVYLGFPDTALPPCFGRSRSAFRLAAATFPH